MTVAIVIPYRPSDPHRERNAQWVIDHYRQLPYPVIVSDHDGDWSKGEAVAAGIAQTDADRLVIADADSFVTNLADAIASPARWVVPHLMVYRLTEPATQAVLDGGQPNQRQLDRPAYPAVPCGGVLVIDRDAYETVGGIDPRFLGWGGEDIALSCALHTLVGPPERLDGDLFHLWHPHPRPDLLAAGEAERNDLKQSYLAAKNVPRLMRALCARTEPEPMVLLAEPVTWYSERATRTVRIGSKTARFRNHLFTTTDSDLHEGLSLFANVRRVK